jgi:hypothetical protein
LRDATPAIADGDGRDNAADDHCDDTTQTAEQQVLL